MLGTQTGVHLLMNKPSSNQQMPRTRGPATPEFWSASWTSSPIFSSVLEEKHSLILARDF